MTRTWPLFFWHQCCACGMEFRRERGWVGTTGPYVGQCGVVRFICHECGQGKAEHVASLMEAASKPKYPPSPPPKNVCKHEQEQPASSATSWET